MIIWLQPARLPGGPAGSLPLAPGARPLLIRTNGFGSPRQHGLRHPLLQYLGQWGIKLAGLHAIVPLAWPLAWRPLSLANLLTPGPPDQRVRRCLIKIKERINKGRLAYSQMGGSRVKCAPSKYHCPMTVQNERSQPGPAAPRMPCCCRLNPAPGRPCSTGSANPDVLDLAVLSSPVAPSSARCRSSMRWPLPSG